MPRKTSASRPPRLEPAEEESLGHLTYLTTLSSEDLLKELRKFNQEESGFWLRRMVAAGLLWDSEGAKKKPGKERKRWLAEVAAFTGVALKTLRQDLLLRKRFFNDRPGELERLAREPLAREYFVTAATAPDPWVAIEEARSGALTREAFRDHVRGLKGLKARKPLKKILALPPSVAEMLEGVRPLFPGKSDEEILRLALSGLEGVEMPKATGADRKGGRHPRKSGRAAGRVAPQNSSATSDGGAFAAAIPGEGRASPRCRDPEP